MIEINLKNDVKNLTDFMMVFSWKTLMQCWLNSLLREHKQLITFKTE